jgi:hypothetical protein
LPLPGSSFKIDRELIFRRWRVEVLRDIGTSAEESLLLAAPQRDADGAPRFCAERAEDTHRFHDGDDAVRVVGGAARGVPRVEVGAEEDDLIPQRRIPPRNLGDDVVAVAILFEVARP